MKCAKRIFIFYFSNQLTNQNIQCPQWAIFQRPAAPTGSSIRLFLLKKKIEKLIKQAKKKTFKKRYFLSPTRINRFFQKIQRRFEAHFLKRRCRRVHISSIERHISSRMGHIVGNQRQMTVIDLNSISAENHFNFLHK